MARGGEVGDVKGDSAVALHQKQLLTRRGVAGAASRDAKGSFGSAAAIRLPTPESGDRRRRISTPFDPALYAEPYSARRL